MADWGRESFEANRRPPFHHQERSEESIDEEAANRRSRRMRETRLSIRLTDPTQEELTQAQFDINTTLMPDKQHIVGIQISRNGETLWICMDGVNVLRIKGNFDLSLDDQRSMTIRELHKTEVALLETDQRKAAQVRKDTDYRG